VFIISDFQTEPVLVDPITQRVLALLDLADAHTGDPLARTYLREWQPS